MDLILRRATLEDLDIIQKLNNELCKYETKNGFDSYISDWSLSDTSKEYFTYMIESEYIIVAEMQGKIVGYLAGSTHKDETYSYYDGITAELDNMFIYEEYRKFGIGTRLVDSFVVWCREQGAKRIMVTASFGNVNTINFYKKNGFDNINITLRKEID
ncbi:MAG: GNAT family N-acetyltransferase [Clostridiales bacterium]|nr:GNAT family N-acetyltransferase [Clostridiales bacterium]